jgi:hypothetical protein
MKKAEETLEQDYVGHVLHIQKTEISRELAKFEAFVENITPYAQKYNGLKLAPLTADTLRSITVGNFTSIIAEFRNLAEADISNISFVFQPTSAEAIENGIAALKTFLYDFQRKCTVYQVGTIIPVIDGLPVITQELKDSIEDRFTNKICTKEGSDFYKQFLIAQAEVKKLTEMGGVPEYHYDWDKAEGLQLSFVPETV